MPRLALALALLLVLGALLVPVAARVGTGSNIGRAAGSKMLNVRRFDRFQMMLPKEQADVVMLDSMMLNLEATTAPTAPAKRADDPPKITEKHFITIFQAMDVLG